MQALETVLLSLERTPALVRELVQEMPPPLRKRRVRPEKWSLHEHACHLALAQDVFEERLARLLAEDNPLIHPYLPDEPGYPDLLALDLDPMLARFEAARRAIVPRLRALTPAQWQRPGRHPEYARYNVYVMFRHAAMHDGLHLYRMEELLLAPSLHAGATP